MTISNTTYAVKEVTVEAARQEEFGKYKASVSVTLTLPPAAGQEDFEMITIEYFRYADALIRDEIERQKQKDKPITKAEVEKQIEEDF